MNFNDLVNTVELDGFRWLVRTQSQPSLYWAAVFTPDFPESAGFSGKRFSSDGSTPTVALSAAYERAKADNYDVVRGGSLVNR